MLGIGRLSTYGLILLAIIFAAGYVITFVQAQADNNKGYVTGAEIRVPFAKNPPRIYGNPPTMNVSCSDHHWKDATVMQMIPYSSNHNQVFLSSAQANLKVMYDNSYYYGCIDWTTQKS